mmetsp:Transcript_21430/g.51808  ORF Transcript_21430/g.51808 Transcript_21430/m.51808 type:complete len:916 (-) Transcript_21430:167-2914(-)
MSQRGSKEQKGQHGMNIGNSIGPVSSSSSNSVSNRGNSIGIGIAATDNSPKGALGGARESDANIDDGKDESRTIYSSSAANSSSSQSGHDDSAKQSGTARDDKKSADHLTNKVSGCLSSSTENKIEATELSNSEDIYVDKINTKRSSRSNQDDSDNSAKEKNTTSHAATMERRSSKRQRASRGSHRYSPGDGGGLASKKLKVNDDGGGKTGPRTAKKDNAVLKAPSGDVEVAAHEKMPHREKVGDNEGSTLKPVKCSKPKYRWIDKGERSNDSKSLEHQGVEIDFTNSKTLDWTPPPPFTVRLGDVVMLSNSDDAPWDDDKQHTHQAKREVVPIYDDPASREAGFGALDPFIGFVERLWEEEADDSTKLRGSSSAQRKKKGKTNNPKASTKLSTGRMMIRTRWFFKKEDLEGFKGSFVFEGASNEGKAGDEVLSAMSSHDLVLTDQSDDNVISTILGKVTVIKRKPFKRCDKDVDMIDLKRSYICRYNLSFCSATSSGKKAMAKLVPCANDTDFKLTTRKGSKDAQSSEPTSTDEHENLGSSTRNYAAPSLSSPYPMSPRRLVSEGGTAIGKIRIGPNHQAEIPEQLDLQRKTSFRGLANPPSQRIPTMVWDPANDKEDTVDDFLEKVCTVLSNHMKKIELEAFLDANYVEAPDTNLEVKKPREINVDCVLTELHECKGDIRRAIKKISKDPERYMTIWNKKEKEQFDTSYRAYRESIRMIANSLSNSKSCKDTVDYQYRFKYVENFRRFMRKKHEKAEEIMAAVEDRMLREKMEEEVVETDVSSSEEEIGKVPATSLTEIQAGSKLMAVPATRVGPVNNRIRTWFRTGGSGDEDAVGATQQRRNLACDFLKRVLEEVGKDAYVALAKSIKACNSSETTDSLLSDVKTTAKDVMKSHPGLLERFMTFLPPEGRCN